MDSDGAFLQMKKDGKLYLVYHHSKYHPLLQTQSPIPSNEADSQEHSLQPLYLCPTKRCQNSETSTNRFPMLTTNILFYDTSFPLIFSPEFPEEKSYHNHLVSPSFLCNNKEFDAKGWFCVCYGSSVGTDYFYCADCRKMYHKECVESPLKIKHPYHPDHSLQLYFHYNNSRNLECLCCEKIAACLVYLCTICEVIMHPVCAMKSIPFVIDQPKRHDHPLTFFPRQTSLTCNVCGWLREKYPTYVCLVCNFVAHKDCMYSPHIIRISRHNHRISYINSFRRSGEWSCGVCHRSINGDYGAYTCEKCGDYAVHSICALGKDVWDGEELECVPEKDDIEQDLVPFKMISDGVILHYLHDHHLRLQESKIYDENKLCQACVLPIYEGDFFSCMKCDFILHITCANAAPRIRYLLHPHPLTLKADNGHGFDSFTCNACDRVCDGFVYECYTGECPFVLDVRCASIVEPFDYKNHEHPLFLSLDPEEKPTCNMCKTKCYKQLNCLKCNFIVCMKCVTLPYKVRYKYEKHFLTILREEEVCDKDWCDVCERDLEDSTTKVFYWCKYCCTTFHIECLFGKDPYLMPGQSIEMYGAEVQILRISHFSRPICDFCKKHCQGKMLKRFDGIACSMNCANEIFSWWPDE